MFRWMMIFFGRLRQKDPLSPSPAVISGHFPGPPLAGVITMTTLYEELCSRRVVCVYVCICVYMHTRMHSSLQTVAF